MDLTRVDLTRVDLTRVDLTRVDLTRVDLTRVDLTRVDLTRGHQPLCMCVYRHDTNIACLFSSSHTCAMSVST